MTDLRQQRVCIEETVTFQKPADGRIQALLSETEKLLESWKHPDPYVHPTAPGGEQDPNMPGQDWLTDGMQGSKYERNLPSPILERQYLSHLSNT